MLAETHGVILYQEQVIEVAMALAGLHRRAGGCVAPLDDPQAIARGDDRALDPVPRGRDARMASVAEIARDGLREAARLRLVRLPEGACGGLRRAGLSILLAEVLLPDRVHLRAAQQPADGLLPLARADQRRQAAWRARLRRRTSTGAASAARSRIGTGSGSGLAYVKTLSGDAARRIVLEREANGPYRSLADFIRRCPIGPDAVENLIAVGAFDRFGLSRREALWQVGLFIPSKRFGIGKKRAAGERGRQLSLALPVEQDMVDAQADGRVGADGGGLRRARPLGPLSPARVAAEPAAGALRDHGRIETLPNGRMIQIAGLIVCRQRPGTAKGVQFLLLEDEVGLVNVVVQPWLYEKRRLTVRGEPFLVITGEIQHQGGAINVVARDVIPLEQARRHYDEISFETIPMPPARTLKIPSLRATTRARSARHRTTTTRWRAFVLTVHQAKRVERHQERGADVSHNGQPQAGVPAHGQSEKANFGRGRMRCSARMIERVDRASLIARGSGSQIVAHQCDIGRLDRCRRAARTHRDPDPRGRKRRGIVNAVSDHRSRESVDPRPRSDAPYRPAAGRRGHRGFRPRRRCDRQPSPHRRTAASDECRATGSRQSPPG